MDSGFLTCRVEILLPGFFPGAIHTLSIAAPGGNTPSEQNELSFSLW